ncbi:unnamed protein product [Discosporangium mesarthrocarpum]
MAPSELQIKGQYKGSISLDLEKSTVMDLKVELCRVSGLPLEGVKLLAGGRHLKENDAKLTSYG